MASKRREGESGIHHVMVRGVAQERIFYDAGDCKRYLALLLKYMDKHAVEIYAWCLMGNHVHLLPRVEQTEDMSSFMHDVNTAYSKYFNTRHHRVGHVMQGRYCSKPVDDDAYLRTVVRYIHQNPLGPHLSRTCDYRWSSYQEYIGKYEPVIASTEFVLSLFDGLEDFIAYHAEEGALDDSLDPNKPRRAKMRPDEAQALVCQILEVGDPRAVASMDKQKRKAAIIRLRKAGMSCRMISETTQVPLGTISSIR